jgi:hypothetical protein
MEVSGITLHHFTPGEGDLGTHRIGGWVRLRRGKEKKFPLLSRPF